MENIIYAMKDLWKNYFNWHGRLSRAGYMWSWAGVLAVNASLIFIRKAVLFLAFFLYPYNELISEILTYAIRIWNIVMFPPLLFATMRRYHDSGNAGWKVIIFSLLSSIFITSGLFIGCFVVIGFVFAGGYMVTAETDVNMAGFFGFVVLSAFLLLAGIGGYIVNIKYFFANRTLKKIYTENQYHTTPQNVSDIAILLFPARPAYDHPVTYLRPILRQTLNPLRNRLSIASSQKCRKKEPSPRLLRPQKQSFVLL